MPPFDPKHKALVDRILKEPDLFPDEFWAAIIHRVQNSAVIQLTKEQLPPNVYLAATDDPTTSRKVEWHSDQRGGAVVADVQAYTGLGPTLVAESIGKGATQPSQAILQTRNPDEVSGLATGITVEQNEGATAAKRQAAVYVPRESDGALVGKVIFDSLGASDFILASQINLGAWSTYTPTWTATGTNPNVGYTIAGRYTQIGKTVICHIDLTSNGGGGGSYGTGTYLFSLPVTAALSAHIGQSLCYDSSAGAHYYGFARYNSTTDVALYTPSQAGISSVLISPTVPFTFAVNDLIQIDFIYEAA